MPNPPLHSRYLLALILWLFSVSAQALDDAERQAIKDVIQAQLDAFQNDDFTTAFSFASPGIQARFGGPELFGSMVKASYQPVYRPRQVFFQELVVKQDAVMQPVLIIDQNHDSVMALYPMEQQPDGSWRIDGCYLAATDTQAL